MRRRDFIDTAAAVSIFSSLSCSSDNTNKRDNKDTEVRDVNMTAKAIHENILTLDTHNDIQFEFIEQGLDLGSRIEKRQVDLVKMEEGGLDAVLQ